LLKFGTFGVLFGVIAAELGLNVVQFGVFDAEFGVIGVEYSSTNSCQYC